MNCTQQERPFTDIQNQTLRQGSNQIQARNNDHTSRLRQDLSLFICFCVPSWSLVMTCPWFIRKYQGFNKEMQCPYRSHLFARCWNHCQGYWWKLPPKATWTCMFRSGLSAASRFMIYVASHASHLDGKLCCMQAMWVSIHGRLYRACINSVCI